MDTQLASCNTEPVSPIQAIERAIKAEVESLDPAGPIDPIIAIHHKAQLLKSVATDLVKLTKAKFVEALKAHGTPDQPASVNVGTTRHYVGTTKTTKPRSHKAIIEAVLKMSGGDEDAIGLCLSSDAWKYGTVRTLIEEAIPDPTEAEAKFNELFEVTTKDSLEDGKPIKGLKTINTNFIR